MGSHVGKTRSVEDPRFQRSARVAERRSPDMECIYRLQMGTSKQYARDHWSAFADAIQWVVIPSKIRRNYSFFLRKAQGAVRDGHTKTTKTGGRHRKLFLHCLHAALQFAWRPSGKVLEQAKMPAPLSYGTASHKKVEYYGVRQVNGYRVGDKVYWLPSTGIQNDTSPVTVPFFSCSLCIGIDSFGMASVQSHRTT